MSRQPPIELPLNWELPDLLDFEFASDQAAKDRDLKRHRKTYLKCLKDTAKADAVGVAPEIDREHVFRYWLEVQRTQSAADIVWPGKLFAQAHKLLGLILVVAGALLGIGLTASLLHYDGSQPINVSRFLFVLLGGQLLILLIGGAAYIMKRFGWLNPAGGFVGPGIHLGLSHLVQWVHKAGVNASTAETRLQLNAFIGSLNKKQSQFQSTLLWVVSRLAQAFGMSFNIAAIVTTLFLVTVSDRAFGWQSSLALSPTQVHGVTEIIAKPWSFVYPSGSPSVQDIDGSRIYLKDGMRRLTNEALVSWWPFLVCSLAAYGLLPRLALWGICHFAIRRQIQQAQFDSLFCDRLWESMIKQDLQVQPKAQSRKEAAPGLPGLPSPTRAKQAQPLPSSSPTPSPSPSIAPQTTPSPKPKPSPSAKATPSPVVEPAKKPTPSPTPVGPTAVKPAPSVVPDRSAFLMVDPELAKRTNRKETDAAIRRALGWTIKEWITLPDELESWTDFWTKLEPEQNDAAYQRIAILQEAFQPPIREALDWLTELRESQGARGKTMIFLIGRPPEAGQLGQAGQTNQVVWEQSIEALNDPNLDVTPLPTATDHE